jgi:hypothetical protein
MHFSLLSSVDITDFHILVVYSHLDLTKIKCNINKQPRGKNKIIPCKLNLTTYWLKNTYYKYGGNGVLNKKMQVFENSVQVIQVHKFYTYKSKCLFSCKGNNSGFAEFY